MVHRIVSKCHAWVDATVHSRIYQEVSIYLSENLPILSPNKLISVPNFWILRPVRTINFYREIPVRFHGTSNGRRFEKNLNLCCCFVIIRHLIQYKYYLVLPPSGNSCINSPAPPVCLLLSYEWLRSQHTIFLCKDWLTWKDALFMSYIDVKINSIFVIK
jgi:hypothetical protein